MILHTTKETLCAASIHVPCLLLPLRSLLNLVLSRTYPIGRASLRFLVRRIDGDRDSSRSTRW